MVLTSMTVRTGGCPLLWEMTLIRVVHQAGEPVDIWPDTFYLGSRLKSVSETVTTVPWSNPSRGITGCLGPPSFEQEKCLG